MQKIKIYFDYQCFPIWVYNHDGELVDNDLPKEVKGEEQLESAFTEIQNIYDSLFIDDLTEFRYVGFSNMEDKEKYLKMVHESINALKTKLGDSYIIEEEIDV